MKCSECDGTDIVGKMASFWVPVDDNGDFIGEFSDYETSTELTGSFLCKDCGCTDIEDTLEDSAYILPEVP